MIEFQAVYEDVDPMFDDMDPSEMPHVTLQEGE